MKPTIIKIIRDSLLCLVIGSYLGLQIAWHDRVGSFTLVPSLEKGYYEMFMKAINDPAFKSAAEREVDLGLGNGPYCKQKDYECAARIDVWANINVNYISDDIQYGGEYFAKGTETLKSKFGDCDDYAILKYQLLKLNGFTVDELSFYGVGMEDTHLPNHAVTGVLINGAEYDMDINYPLPIEFKYTENTLFVRMTERGYTKIKNWWALW